ncbi:MAG: hypothetical protein AAF636_27095 [Pseudomonadota bacterium]
MDCSFCALGVARKNFTSITPIRKEVQHGPTKRKEATSDHLAQLRAQSHHLGKQNNKGAVFHTVTFARTYEDKDGRLQDSHSFSRSELLRVAKLADRSDDLIEDRRRELAVERTQDQAPSQEGRSDRFHNQSYGRNGPGLER